MSIDSLPWACPPFTSTTRGPSCRIRSPARSMSSSERIGISASTSASGMFGVTICASGSSSDFNAATAAASSSRSPPFAIMTGSTTIGHRRVRRQRSGDSADDCGVCQHADLDGVGADVAEHRLDLLHHERRADGLPGQDAERVLRRNRGQRARAEDAVRGKRLEIRLDSGSAAGIAAGDCQCSTHTLKFAANVRSYRPIRSSRNAAHHRRRHRRSRSRDPPVRDARGDGADGCSPPRSVFRCPLPRCRSRCSRWWCCSAAQPSARVSGC